MIVMPKAFNVDVASADEEPGLAAQRIMRLSDAERIATNRLDGAAEGSLKEALATTIPVPQPASLRLVDRIDEIRRLAETVTPLASFHAAPFARLGWEDAVPPAHAMPTAVIAEPLPDQPDHFADVPSPGSSASWEQAWSAWKGQDPVPPADEVAAAPVDEAHAIDATDTIEEPLHVDEAPVESRDAVLLPVAGSEVHGHVAAFATEDCRAQVMAPIVSAYAENAKLAAEATAASHALHNLKLFLTEKMAEEATDLFGPERDAPNDPADRIDPADVVALHADEVPVETISEPDPEPAAEVIVEAAPPVVDEPAPIAPAVAKGPPPLPASAFVSAAVALPPTPPQAPIAPPPVQEAAPAPKDERAERRALRPEIAEVPSAPERKTGPVVAAAPRPVQTAAQAALAKAPEKGARKKKAAPKVMRKSRSDTSHSPLDVGGFMAGFALSGAIGVVLYFVMSAS